MIPENTSTVGVVRAAASSRPAETNARGTGPPETRVAILRTRARSSGGVMRSLWAPTTVDQTTSLISMTRSFTLRALYLVVIVIARERGASPALIGALVAFVGVGGILGSLAAPVAARRASIRTVITRARRYAHGRCCAREPRRGDDRRRPSGARTLRQRRRGRSRPLRAAGNSRSAIRDGAPRFRRLPTHVLIERVEINLSEMLDSVRTRHTGRHTPTVEKRLLAGKT